MNMPRRRPRKNFGQKNYGLIFRSLTTDILGSKCQNNDGSLVCPPLCGGFPPPVSFPIKLVNFREFAFKGL